MSAFINEKPFAYTDRDNFARAKSISFCAKAFFNVLLKLFHETVIVCHIHVMILTFSMALRDEFSP